MKKSKMIMGIVMLSTSVLLLAACSNSAKSASSSSSSSSKTSQSSSSVSKSSSSSTTASSFSQEDLDAAATAAHQRKYPNSDDVVKTTRSADGFAMAVLTMSRDGEIEATWEAVFKVAKDGTMTEIFSSEPVEELNMLELGIPFTTQAKITGQSLETVMQNFDSQTGYTGGNTPVYDENSFAGVEANGINILLNAKNIAGSAQVFEAKLNAVIEAKNAATSDKIVYVTLLPNNNAQVNNPSPNVAVLTKFQAQFITENGNISTHDISIITTNPNNTYLNTYTLDGKNIGVDNFQ